jgi:hypothetical protein
VADLFRDGFPGLGIPLFGNFGMAMRTVEKIFGYG